MIYRPAQPDDIREVHGVHERALPTRPEFILNDKVRLSIYQHLLDTDPKGFWVAEYEGEIIGFSSAIVRGDVWFLSNLFVSPEHQGQSVGGKLLDFSLRTSAKKKVRSVHSSFDPRAVALYARAGMFPISVFTDFIADASKVCLPSIRSRFVELEKAQARNLIDEMSKIDALVWGSRRPEEHRFWIESNRFRYFASLNRSGKLLGYYYICEDDPPICDPTIGPLASRDSKLTQEMLISALYKVQRYSRRAVLKVPAENHAALQLLISSGFEIKGMSLLMANRPYGDFQSYLASGPDLL